MENSFALYELPLCVLKAKKLQEVQKIITPLNISSVSLQPEINIHTQFPSFIYSVHVK